MSELGGGPCWCDLTLVDGKCPVHGEKWRRRECELSRPGYPEEGGEPMRICLGPCGPGYVTMDYCDECNIPPRLASAALWDACGEKLVEAVKAMCRGVCDAEIKSGVGGCDHRLAQAAIAAYEEAEKEAAS